MNSHKALSMLEAGKIEELKKLLQDEIYTEALKSKPGAKKRYAAMKRYFQLYKPIRECLQKPCPVVFEDRDYISFCNAWSLVLTTEDTGELELYEDPERYPDVAHLLRFDGLKKKIDFSNVIAEAKSKGYRLKKGEIDYHFKYLMLYDGTYYKLGLIDMVFSILDNGEVCMTYHPDGTRMPLTIQNSLGIGVIMPVKFHTDDPEDDGRIVIEVN